MKHFGFLFRKRRPRSFFSNSGIAGLAGKAAALMLLLLPALSFSQTVDSLKATRQFSGAVSVTNNGISLIPTFSLGKPAAIFNMSVGKRKLSFEPELRFSLEGKPWSFVFWWRYKLLSKNKFRVSIGAHPALNFSTETYPVNGVTKNVIMTRRYVAAEVAPNYALSKNISIGLYYLHGHGLQEEGPKKVNFITINSTFSDIKLTDQFSFRIVPQFYYLKQDNHDGFYFTSAVSLAKRNFPVLLQSIINKTIQTTIPDCKDFVWNATLMYFFQ